MDIIYNQGNNSYVVEEKAKNIQKEEAKERLVPLIRKLIGERSIRKTAEESGVTAAYITNILKKKSLPSVTILRKLSDSSANPQNGVTFEELMAAAGNREIDNTDIESEDTVKTAVRLASYLSAGQSMREKAAGAGGLQSDSDGLWERGSFEYTAAVRGIIVNTLMLKGLDFRFIKSAEESGKDPADMTLFVEVPQIMEWRFKLYRFSFDIDAENMLMFSEIMGLPPVRERKISVITENEKQFERLLAYQDKVAYRGDLSAILVDFRKMKVLKEAYIAHYEAEGPYSDFTLI